MLWTKQKPKESVVVAFTVVKANIEKKKKNVTD